MRFLHTSDWQIGKAFGVFADEATRDILRAERLDVIGRIGRLAREHNASAILVAGDIYDEPMPSDRTLRQPIERMRQFPGLTWHLIPGNHDPHIASGVWDRLRRVGLPGNVVTHTTPEPVQEGEAWVVPAVLDRRHVMGDPTEHFDTAATPEGAVRIGLAHGSMAQFGSDASSTHNLIAYDRSERAGLGYLALGDWHGAQSIGPRSWYAGTPEVDGFDLGGRGGGEVLLVDLAGPAAMPSVTPLATGRFVWRRESAALVDDAAVAALDRRVRALHADPSLVLLWLKVSGTLSTAGLIAFERLIRDGLGSALGALRLDDAALVAQPSADDLAALGRAGSVGIAANELARVMDDPAGTERGTARDALRRLYLFHAARTLPA
jgi:DNA repair exonuclease SbcCD nuclease subunit